MYVPGQWLLVARCSPRVSVHTISAKRDFMWTEINGNSASIIKQISWNSLIGKRQMCEQK